MKAQIFFLLGLMCFSAFSQFTTLFTVETDAGTIELGTQDGDCKVRLSDDSKSHTYAGNANDGDCVPKEIFNIDDRVWVLFQVSEGGQLMVTDNSPTNSQDEFNRQFLSNDMIVDNVVLIGEIDLDANFGKFLWASYLFAGTGSGQSAVVGKFEITDISSCSDTIIQLQGNTEDGHSVAGSANAFVPEATGTGAFIAFDTSDNSFTGYAPDNSCGLNSGNGAEEEEEGNGEENGEGNEEEEEEGNNASIFSIASVLLAFFGFVAL